MDGQPFCTICHVWCGLDDDPHSTTRRGWFCPSCNTNDPANLDNDSKVAVDLGVTTYTAP